MNTKQEEVMAMVVRDPKARPKEVQVSRAVPDWARPKQCYNNAFRYASENPGFRYVLGYLLFKGVIPIEHAWVWSARTGHIDVTLPKDNDGDIYVEVYRPSMKWCLEFAVGRGYPPSESDYSRAKTRGQVRESRFDFFSDAVFEASAEDLAAASVRDPEDVEPQEVIYRGLIRRTARRWHPTLLFDVGRYRCRVRLPDMREVSRLVKGDPERAAAAMGGDVVLHCTCPDWRWGGYQYMATQRGYAIDPLDIPAPVRNPLDRGSVCKHLTRLLPRLEGFAAEVGEDLAASRANGYNSVRR